jgi:hypothetical protein
VPIVGVGLANVGDHRRGRPTADLKSARPARRWLADDPTAHRVGASCRPSITDGRAVTAPAPDSAGERSSLRHSPVVESHVFLFSLNRSNPYGRREHHPIGMICPSDQSPELALDADRMSSLKNDEAV